MIPRVLPRIYLKTIYEASIQKKQRQGKTVTKLYFSKVALFNLFKVSNKEAQERKQCSSLVIKF